MFTHLNMYVAIWILIAGCVLLLALYRLAVDKGDYTILHVRRSEVTQIPKQVIRAERLDIIDQWGKVLTVLALVYGVAMGLGYLLMNLSKQ